MTPKLFSELGLSPELLKAIDKLGFEQASPIQAEAIPILLQGRDIVGQSQTGSGKTAAFAIPAIERVDPALRAVQILVLCPTRELAVQVSEEIHKLTLFKRGVHALPIYGGQAFERQLYGLRQGAQIVIGTPGRVMDHMRRATLRLDSVKMVILDEADVMLNMGFREDIETILQSTPASRQTVFFSATVPRPIQDLIQRHARDPQNVRIEQRAATVPTVEQVYYEVDRRFKVELLTRLIDIHDLKLGIIFCNTKRAVDDLVEHLNAQGYSADRLHGDMNQTMRDRVMNRFRKSGLEFLVATDVAARGIDVDDVQVVFNFDLPYDGEDYVHRIGRTGRAGRSGMAISFAAGREVFQIRNIERFTNVRIQRGRAPSVDEVEEARVSVYLDKVRAALRSGEFKRHDHLVERLLEEGFTSTDIASALLHLAQESASGGAKGAPERPRGAGSDERLPPRPGGMGIGDGTGSLRPALTAKTSSKAPGWGPSVKPVAPSPPRVTPPPAKVKGALPKETMKVTPRAAVIEAAGEEAGKVVNADKAVEAAEVHELGEVGKVGETVEVGQAVAAVVTIEGKEPEAGAAVAPSKPKPGVAAIPSGATGKVETVRVWMSVGEHAGLEAEDLIASIISETGLGREVIRKVEMRDRFSIVEVPKPLAEVIVAKMKRVPLMGRRLKVKLA